MEPWSIRRLVHGDISIYRPLRLEALRAHSEAFGVSYEEEQAEDTGRLIAGPPGITLGGFARDRLVGSAGLMVPTRVKQRHKGHVVAVYVAPAWRRTGLARALLDGLIAHARSVGLITLTLSVTAGNRAARGLYLGVGFRPYGMEPRSLRVGDVLLDEELLVLDISGRDGPPR